MFTLLNSEKTKENTTMNPCHKPKKKPAGSALKEDVLAKTFGPGAQAETRKTAPMTDRKRRTFFIFTVVLQVVYCKGS